MALASAKQGERAPVREITWMRSTGCDPATPEDLTGRTIAGRLLNLYSGQARAIDGALVLTDPPNGKFTWEFGANDTGTPGDYLVLLSATQDGKSAMTMSLRWHVETAF